MQNDQGREFLTEGNGEKTRLLQLLDTNLHELPETVTEKGSD